MKRAGQATRPLSSWAPRATYAVRFTKCKQKRSRASQKLLAGRIPRVTRLLALAHRIDAMIRSGEIRDLADAARLVGVIRARMTQIANLLLLAPEVQEAILDVPCVVKGSDPITERQLREIVSEVDWSKQRISWAAAEMASRPTATP